MSGQRLAVNDLIIADSVEVADSRFLVITALAVERPRALEAREPRRLHQQHALAARSQRLFDVAQQRRQMARHGPYMAVTWLSASEARIGRAGAPDSQERPGGLEGRRPFS